MPIQDDDPEDGRIDLPSEAEDLKRIRLTAWHEAGHAVVAIVLGLDVEFVRIRRQLELLGQTISGEQMAISGGQTKIRSETIDRCAEANRIDRRRIIALMAGVTAEHHAGSDDLLTPGESDLIEACAEEFYSLRFDLAPEFELLRAKQGGSVEEAFLKQLSGAMSLALLEAAAEAERLVLDNWAAVEAVAWALFERRELSGEQVRHIVLASKVDPC